jgi:hypothetical protein
MKKSNKFPPEVRERAVSMVQEHRGEYRSLRTAIESIAPKMFDHQALHRQTEIARPPLPVLRLFATQLCGMALTVSQL